MFDFENLIIYNKSKELNRLIFSISLNNSDLFIRRQLDRASLSILANIAEASGRRTSPDKKKFFSIARGSLYECISICDLLMSLEKIDQEKFDQIYSISEEISKMLYTLINSNK